MLQHLTETALRHIFDLSGEGNERELTRFVSEMTEPESIELLAVLWHGQSVRERISFEDQLSLSRSRHDTHNLTGIPEDIGGRWFEVRSMLLWGLRNLAMEERQCGTGEM